MAGEINFDLYKSFCTVAKMGSISAAANALGVSQSAVSQSVKQLETALGGKLFNRGARGVTLTAEGRAVYEYAKGAYDMLENAEKTFRKMADMNAGEVRIGASDTICSLFLLDKIDEYHAMYPDITIRLFSDNSDTLIERLRSGEIDLAFANLPVLHHEGLSCRTVMEIGDCFVAGKKFASLAHRTVTLSELEDYPILMLDKRSSTRRVIDLFLSQKNIRLAPQIELGSVDMLVECARMGLGISLVIEQAAAPFIESGELYKLQLSEPLPRRSIGMMTTGEDLSIAAKHFVERLC